MAPFCHLELIRDQPDYLHIRVLKATTARSPWIRTPNLSVRAPLSQPWGLALLMSDMLVTSKTPVSKNLLFKKTPLSLYMSIVTRPKQGAAVGDNRSTSSGEQQHFSFLHSTSIKTPNIHFRSSITLCFGQYVGAPGSISSCKNRKRPIMSADIHVCDKKIHKYQHLYRNPTSGPFISK